MARYDLVISHINAFDIFFYFLTGQSFPGRNFLSWVFDFLKEKRKP